MTAVDAVLAQWDGWLGDATDRLMDLDARTTAADAGLKMDVAAAFVCRKAIAAHIEAMRAAGPDANTVAQQPVVDDQGQTVGSSLESAATLLTAVLDRVEGVLGVDESRNEQIAADSTAAATDLAIAERLAVELGQNVNRVAQARSQLDAAGRVPVKLRDIAAVAAQLRAELETADAQRDQMFQEWASVDQQIEQYRARETEVCAVVERCREKVRPLPNMAVPSVEALGAVTSVDELRAMPWPAARAVMQPLLTRLDRIDDAFDQVEQQFSAVLSRRNELRGLLHAFRDKAGGSGLAEQADLEHVFKDAERELWSAPCDVDAAATLVGQYTAAVNRTIQAGSAPSDQGAR